MRNVAALRALYSEDQARDERGRFGPGGGSASGVLSGTIPPGLQKWVEQKKAEKAKTEPVIKTKGKLPPGLQAYLDKKKAEQGTTKPVDPTQPPPKIEPPTPPEPPKPELQPEPEGKREGGMVNARADEIAAQMGFDPDRIDVVALDSARLFMVGDQQFREAGHFDPTTGRIQVDANVVLNSGGGRGVLVHEVAHAQFEYAQQKALAEASKVYEQYGHWWDQQKDQPNPAFTKAGTLRAEYKAEVLKNNPAIAAFHAAGMPVSGFLGGDIDFAGLKKDDGVSNYSKAYWDAKNPNYTFAVNETLSEIARIHYTGARGMGDTVPSRIPARFDNLRAKIAAMYKERTNDDKVREQQHYLKMRQKYNK